MCLDESLGDGQPEPGPAAAAVLAEHLEHPLPVVAGDARSVIRHRDFHPSRRAPRRDARPDADDAVVGGEPFGILEHVRQHLADEHVIDAQQRKIGGHLGLDPSRSDDSRERLQRLSYQVVKSYRGGPKLERSRLDPGHIEQIGHQPGQSVRLQFNQLEQLSPVAGTQLDVGPPQARHSRLDGGERCPKVMGCGPHERVAPAVDLLEEARAQRLLPKASPVDGEGCLVGERAQQAAVPPSQPHLLEHKHAHGPVARHQRQRYPLRRVADDESEGTSLAPARREGGKILVSRSLAGGRGYPQRCTRPRCLAVALWQDEGGPARAEHVLDCVRDVCQQLGEGEIADQGLGELIEPSRLLGAPEGLFPGVAQLSHHLGDDQHDDHVDHDREPVLWRADGQGRVGREEEVVVDEKARHCADGAGNKAPDDHADKCGQHENEGRQRDARGAHGTEASAR